MSTRKSKEYYIAKAREMCAAEGKGKNIRMSGQLVPHLEFLRVQEVENFIVVTVDGAHRLKNIHTITSGILNKTIVHPREVFRPAIVDRAAAIFLVHNHPSGQTSPSDEDRAITKRLASAAEIISIPILDHIIIPFGEGTDYFSFCDAGESLS